MAAIIPKPPESLLEQLDANVFDLVHSVRDIFQAHANGHEEGVADAVLRHVNAHAWFYYTCLGILRGVSQAVVAFAEEVPHIFSLLQNESFILGTTICGFFTNAITAVQETIGIMRESRILSIFQQSSYQDNPDALAEDIEGLTGRYTPAELATRLRPWFVEKEELTTHDRLNALAVNVRAGDVDAIDEAKQLLGDMRVLVIKKLALHIIGALASILSIAGLICSLVTCPPLAVVLLLGLGMLVWNVRVVMSKGYVDNPDGGFSFLRCLPEFISDCFRPKAAVVA